MIGDMAMPADFRYKDVFLKGQPAHEPFDPFRLRHPAMDPGRRAKIFAPFDALTGFDDAVASKEVLYEFKREPGDEEKEELDRRLGILRRLTRNGRLARENAVPVEVTFYVPCTDEDSFSYGFRGRHLTLPGICRKVGLRSILVDDTAVPLQDIVRLESPLEIGGQNIFDCWEVGAS